MFSNAHTLFRVRGIEVRAHASWLIIAAIIAWSLFSRLQLVYGHRTAVALPLAIVGAALFFGSVLVHELAHAIEGQHRGARVYGITLFLFGGATESDMNLERPRDEFAMSAVGPWISLVTAATMGLLVTGLDTWGPDGLDAVTDLLGIVGWVNVGLGVFNLLPGAPLDGGRVLRAAVWQVTGDRERAARVAARAGQGLGLLLAGLGAWQFLAFAAGSFNGLWFIVLGWFLFAAASQEHRMSTVRGLLAGRTLRDLLGSPPVTVEADADADAVADLLTRRDPDAAAVVADGAVAGAVTLDGLAGHGGPVRELMIPREALAVVTASDGADVVFDHLGGSAPILVLDDDGDVVGVLTPQRLATTLYRIQQLGVVEGGGRGWDREGRWIPRGRPRDPGGRGRGGP